MLIAQHLRQCGIEVSIFADGKDPQVNWPTIGQADAIALVKRPSTVMLYVHCIFWEKAEELIHLAECAILIRYHNITPARFFANFDRVTWAATKAGCRQTESLAFSGKISQFLPVSEFNAQHLRDLFVPDEKIIIVPHLGANFHRVPQTDDKNLFDDGRMHVLFVGRFVANKGHQHLIAVVDHYRHLFDDDICLHIIGSIPKVSEAYKSYVDLMIAKRGLKDYLNFVGSVSETKLAAYYRSCHAFLLTSEHEGFCLPIIEAQKHGLPIVAWAKGAVAETVGRDQLVFPALDYHIFAAALRRLRTDQRAVSFLRRAGHANLLRFQTKDIQFKIFNIVKKWLRLQNPNWLKHLPMDPKKTEGLVGIPS